MRESFIFYGSFLNAIELLSDKSQLKLYKVLTNFALKGSDFSSILSKKELAIFELIKPQILANIERYENGKKGGRPPQGKTTGFENKKPNKNVNDNDNVNVNVNDNPNVNVNEKVTPIKRTTDYISFYQKIKSEYENVVGNVGSYLNDIQAQELFQFYINNPNFMEVLPQVLNEIKRLREQKGASANITWLYGDKWSGLLNHSYDFWQDKQPIEPQKTRLEEIDEMIAAAEEKVRLGIL